MKRTSKPFLWLALMTLLVSMLACSIPALPFTVQVDLSTPAPTSPLISNIRMTTDETGKNPTATYAPNESFVVFIDLGNLQTGTVVEAKWYSVNVAGVTPNTLINVSDYSYEAGVANLHFKLNATGGGQWPIGSYKVEIYLNGLKIGEVPFYVN